MNTLDFLQKYKIAKERFASMVHVGLRTLNKYIEGKPIREDSRERIERGIRIIIDNNLVQPEMTSRFNIYSNQVWFNEVREYEAKFERLFKEGV